jgi:hypothetical protein
MGVHGLGVGMRHYEPGGHPALGADGTKDVGPFVSGIARSAGARSTLGPDAGVLRETTDPAPRSTSLAGAYTQIRAAIPRSMCATKPCLAESRKTWITVLVGLLRSIFSSFCCVVWALILSAFTKANRSGRKKSGQFGRWCIIHKTTAQLMKSSS